MPLSTQCLGLQTVMSCRRLNLAVIDGRKSNLYVSNDT